MTRNIGKMKKNPYHKAEILLTRLVCGLYYASVSSQLGLETPYGCRSLTFMSTKRHNFDCPRLDTLLCTFTNIYLYMCTGSRHSIRVNPCIRACTSYVATSCPHSPLANILEH
jgi:hypothetical protein